MTKASMEAIRQRINSAHTYTSKALEDICKEEGCKNARQNGSSRCINHSHK